MNDDQIPPEFSTDRAPETSEDQPLLEWTAAEFLAHKKSNDWYLKLGCIAAAAALAIFLTTQDKIAAGFVLFCAFLLGVFAGREPKQIPYILGSEGFIVGARYHNYDDFRSFGIVLEPHISSIVLMPLKRLAQTVTIYYEAENEDAITAILVDRLPYEDHKHDPLERFLRRVRF